VGGGWISRIIGSHAGRPFYALGYFQGSYLSDLTLFSLGSGGMVMVLYWLCGAIIVIC